MAVPFGVMDRRPSDPPRPYEHAQGDELRFDALATGTLRGLWAQLRRWAVPSGYVGREDAFAPHSARMVVTETEAAEAFLPWFELEDQLESDVVRYGCAFTLTTRSGTRRVEPWRVSVSMVRDAPYQGGEHLHLPEPLRFDPPEFDYQGGQR